ncbi:MAG: RNA methyltransferase [Erysipelotrichaceae bacterium]|nr:RNA methyltransferase [Erysipelotrichaceae bacterium]MDY5252020.1 RNA methyltransferase [Erysipelotrichaceae bacterium]
MIFEGALSVKAAIKGRKRVVEKVIIAQDKHSKDISYIKKLCAMNQIPVELWDKAKINTIAAGKTHGGILAIAQERSYQPLESMLKKPSFICLLEGIEDPFNLGYILRSLYSAGCTGVLCGKRDWQNVENIICKSSAGASEFIDICQSDDLAKDLAYLKAQGVKCYAAYRNQAISYLEQDYRQDILIAIGGEMRGLSKDVLNAMDGYVYIPYANDFRNALNASSAASVIAYEVLRQRSQM